MQLPFFIGDVALLFGDSSHTSEFFAGWLRGHWPNRQASFVNLRQVPAHGTRRAFLLRAVLCELGAHESRVISYAEFVERGAPPGSVVAAACCGDEGDFAVAFVVAEDGVQVTPTRGSEWALPIPDLPTAVLAPFSLGLAALVARHGYRPGKMPEPHDGPVRVGQTSVSALAHLPLKVRQRVLVDEEVASVPVVMATPPLELEQLREEAAEMVAAGRTFDRNISVRQPCPGKVAICFNGTSVATPGLPGSWDVHFRVPEFAQAVGLLERTLRWHQFIENLLADCGLRADVRLGHSVGRVSAFGDVEASLKRLEGTELLDELSGGFGAVRTHYAHSGRVDAASGEDQIWQAWLVLGPVETVEKVVAGQPLVELTERRGPLECVIAGFPDAIDLVMLELLNSPRMHATDLDTDLAVHTTAAANRAAELQRVFGVDGLDRCEDIEPQVRAAWEAGVRVFVDVGPRAGFSHWIPRILEGLPHQVVAIDGAMAGPLAAIDGLTRLRSLGLDVDLRGFEPIFEPQVGTRVRLPPHEAPTDWLVEAQRIQAEIVAAHQRFVARQRTALDAMLAAHRAALVELSSAIAVQNKA